MVWNPLADEHDTVGWSLFSFLHIPKYIPKYDSSTYGPSVVQNRQMAQKHLEVRLHQQQRCQKRICHLEVTAMLCVKENARDRGPHKLPPAGAYCKMQSARKYFALMLSWHEQGTLGPLSAKALVQGAEGSEDPREAGIRANRRVGPYIGVLELLWTRVVVAREKVAYLVNTTLQAIRKLGMLAYLDIRGYLALFCITTTSSAMLRRCKLPYKRTSKRKDYRIRLER